MCMQTLEACSLGKVWTWPTVITAIYLYSKTLSSCLPCLSSKGSRKTAKAHEAADGRSTTRILCHNEAQVSETARDRPHAMGPDLRTAVSTATSKTYILS